MLQLILWFLPALSQKKIVFTLIYSFPTKVLHDSCFSEIQMSLFPFQGIDTIESCLSHSDEDKETLSLKLIVVKA